MANFRQLNAGVVSGLVAFGLSAQPVLAQKTKTELPESILPETAPTVPATSKPAARPEPAAAPSAVPTQVPGRTPAAPSTSEPLPGTVQTIAEPVVQELFLSEPVMSWSLADAQDLLSTIELIGKEGLLPADYKPAYYWWDCLEMLRKAILTGILVI